MPATFIPDIVAGSQVSISGNAAEAATRSGIIVGLPTTGNPEDVLWAALSAAGMPAMGSLYPNRVNCWLTRIEVAGISHDTASVKLVYEPFQGVGSVLIIDVGSTLSTFTTNMVPGTKQPIGCEWIPNDTKHKPIPMDYVATNMLRPLQRVSVTQLRQGTLDAAQAAAYADYVGRVNAVSWMNKDPGFWIINAANITVSKYGGYFQARIEALSQGDDCWSYYGILRNSQTGKFAGGKKGSSDDLNTSIGSLLSLPYVPRSVRYPSGSATKGVVRVDPYRTTNFTTLFGF